MSTTKEKAKKVLLFFGKALYFFAGLVFKAVGMTSNAALEIRAEINEEIKRDREQSDKKKRPWQR